MVEKCYKEKTKMIMNFWNKIFNKTADLFSKINLSKKSIIWIVGSVVVIVGLVFLCLWIFMGGHSSNTDVVLVTQANIKVQKNVITDYYQAIDSKNYKKAYSLTSKNFQRGLSYSNFKYQYKNYINSVQVKSIARLEQFSTNTSGAYNVTFNATYKNKYPVGDGTLPTIHVVQRDKTQGNDWKIDSIGIKTNG